MRAFFLCLLACGDSASTPSPAVEEADPIEPSPYVYEGEDAATGEFDADALSAALDDFAAGILRYNASPVLVAYDEALAHGDAGCPAWYEADGNVFWYAECTTEAGASFSGYGTRTVYTQVDLNGDGALWDGLSVYGSGLIQTPEGEQLELGGQAAVAVGLHPEGYQPFYSVVQGGFAWGGESADESWLSEGGSPTLTLYGAWVPEFGLRYLTLAGTVGGLSSAATAVQTDGILIGDEALGFPCVEEPAGAISIRDALGGWWTVTFDIDPDDLRLTGACDGCGTVTDPQGAVVGEACMDASPLLDWSELPW